jgi:hypothetical protein
MSLVNDKLRALGSHATRHIAERWGKRCPFVHVVEFPKSGGNWLSRMLADYLGIPFLNNSILPPVGPRVIHSHWNYSAKLNKVFYLYRDGRDVAVSMYYHCARRSQTGSRSVQRYIEMRTGLTRADFDNRDHAADNFKRFVASWLDTPIGCNSLWGEHVRDWAFDRPNVVSLSYEQLIHNCVLTLQCAIESALAEAVDLTRLKTSISKFSFENQTGRARGHADPSSFIRKGVCGDWMNYFDADLNERFHNRFGTELMQLGYDSSYSFQSQLNSAGITQGDQYRR